jgi:hypothetical protein
MVGMEKATGLSDPVLSLFYPAEEDQALWLAQAWMSHSPTQANQCCDRRYLKPYSLQNYSVWWEGI